MEIYTSFSYWLFQPYAWLILGISIIIIDVFLGFVLLPFGISSLMVSGLMFSDKFILFEDFIFFDTWQDILLCYALLSLVSVGILKVLLQNKIFSKTDINKY